MTEQEPETQTPDSIPDGDEGVGLTSGEPNTFEPEEDPDAAPEPGAAPPE